MSELVARLEMNQPAVSKHLRVLREAGLVRVRVDEQRRLYRLTPAPLRELDLWLAPYRAAWESSLDKLERHLDQMDQDEIRGRAMTMGKLEDLGGRWQLRFTRELAHPQEKVWRAITEPEHMQAWFPQHVSGEWVPGGRLTFSSPDGRGPDFDGEVLAYQPQSLVEFRWGPDVIRMELEGRPDGCTLTLLDTFAELGKAARDAAGWHECLDRLSDYLDAGKVSFPPGQRWSEVYPRYVGEFGPEAAAIGPPTG